MSQRSLLRSLLVVVLSLALGSPAASATPVNWESFLAEQGRSASRFLEAVITRLPEFAKAGCTIDPDGQPLCATKHGCSIDPNGHTVCAPWS
jgi:hypothetical protein